jgi:hypothetical protein
MSPARSAPFAVDRRFSCFILALLPFPCWVRPGLLNKDAPKPVSD